MSWKCLECGYEPNCDSERRCCSCGHVTCPATLVLTSQEMGKALRMRINADVGRGALRAIVGDDARFATDVQFRIRKRSGEGRWVIEHNSEAKNPTCYNGKPLDAGGQELAEGGTISIGADKAVLRVSFDR